jgi:hypothetical protein
LARSYDIVTSSQAAMLGLTRLWIEAGSVIALRSFELGQSPGPLGEDRRMIDEKAPAFARAALAAWQASTLAAFRNPFDPIQAAFAGGAAWTRLLTGKARSNRRRLSARARP